MHLKHTARTMIAFALGVATAAAIAAADSSTSPPVLFNPGQGRLIEQPQPAPPHTPGRAAVKPRPDQKSFDSRRADPNPAQ